MIGRQAFLVCGLVCGISLVATAQAWARGIQAVRDEEIEKGLKIISTPVLEQAGVPVQTTRFILVQDDDLNAFVAGGQNIFINTGLILKTDDVSELVGVIAHETGHIALAHLFRAQEAQDDYKVQSWLASAIGIVAAVGAKSGQAGMAGMAAGQSMAIRSAMTRTRTAEASADQAGARYLQDAHLPLSGFLTFMKKIANQELLPDTEQSEYVRNHPLSQDRVDFLENATAAQVASKIAEPAEWQDLHRRIKAKLLGYLYPDRALQDKSETVDARYARAIAWYRKGEMDKSLNLLESIIADEPKNPYFYELKGQTLFEAGRVDESLPAYARAVELAPKAGLIRSAWGRALIESKTGGKGRMQEAVKQLRVSLETEPRAPQTYHALAVAYGRMGEEGQSRLALAEKYLLTGQVDLTRREAGLALKALPQGAPARLRAEDIMAATDKKFGDKKKE